MHPNKDPQEATSLSQAGRSVWIPGQSSLGPSGFEEKIAGVALSAHLGFGLQFEKVSRKKNSLPFFTGSWSVAQASLKL